MTLAGDEIFDCFDPMPRTGRPDLDLAEMKPEFARTLLRERHRDSRGIVVRRRFFDVADDLRVVDLCETQVARLLQGRIGSANAIYLSDIALDIARPIPIPALELVFLGIEVLLPSRYRLVFEQLEAVVDAVARGQRGGEHEPRLEHPWLAGLQMEGKNVRRIDEEIGAE